MIETPSHPGQSPELLSRRHDGELDPSEAAAFEAHRRECPLCDAAVADFERALAAYRSAPVPVHAADLSARILRKIRAASPSRRPFGVTFGIDLRWAGVLAAALLVVIIGAPVFSRRENPLAASPGSSRTPIPVYVLGTERERPPQEQVEAKAGAPAIAPPKSEPAAPRSSAGPRASAPASRPAPPEAAADAAAALPQENAATAAEKSPEFAGFADKSAREASDSTAIAHAPSPAARQKEERSPGPTARRQSASAPVGGDAAGGADEPASGVVRLLIRPADGEGQAPQFVSAPSDARLAVLRGREYVLVVDAGGRVVAVEERSPGRLTKDAAGESDARSESPARSLADSLLRELVFQASDRARRLIVAIR